MTQQSSLKNFIPIFYFRTVKFGNQFGSIFGPVDLGEAVSTLYPNHDLDEWLDRLKEQNKISAESITADPIGEVDDNAIKIGFIVRVGTISKKIFYGYIVSKSTLKKVIRMLEKVQ